MITLPTPKQKLYSVRLSGIEIFNNVLASLRFFYYLNENKETSVGNRMDHHRTTSLYVSR